MKAYEREILKLAREGNLNICASPGRGHGKRHLQLLAMGECWKRGITTAMIAKDFVSFNSDLRLEALLCSSEE